MFNKNKHNNIIQFENIKTRFKKNQKSNVYQLVDSAGLPTIKDLLDKYQERLDRLRESDNKKISMENE